MESEETIGQRVARLREAKGLSQRELGASVGHSQTSIYYLEIGRTKEPKRLDQIARVLGVSHEYLKTGQEEPDAPQPPSEVPVVGLVGAGSAMQLYSDADPPIDHVEAPEDATPETVAVEIRGESLGPFFNGWLVFYDDVRSPADGRILGTLCVVGLADGRVLLKEVQRSDRRGRFNLMSQFEPPVYDAQVLWAAPVKSMRPWRKR